MNPDLAEQRLRDALHFAADAEAPGYLDVDPGVALVAGHRVVRRRRLAMVGGTAVVIAVMGVGGWAAQAQRTEQSQRPLPASTSSVAASATATATLELRSEEPGGAGAGLPHSVRVALDATKGTVTCEWVGATPVGDSTLAVLDSNESTLPNNPQVGTYGVTGIRPGTAAAGVFPIGAETVIPLWAGSEPACAVITKVLPGTGRTAFAIWWEATGSDTVLGGFLSADGTTVRNAGGAPVPSATWRDYLVFADTGVFGIVNDDATSTKRLADVTPGARPVLALTTRADGSAARTRYLMLLPADATDVVPRAANGVTIEASAVLDLGLSAGKALVADLSTPSGDLVEGPGITEVTWKDVTGATASAPGG